jgi:hypothetical protein
LTVIIRARPLNAKDSLILTLKITKDGVVLLLLRFLRRHRIEKGLMQKGADADLITQKQKNEKF